MYTLLPEKQHNRLQQIEQEYEAGRLHRYPPHIIEKIRKTYLDKCDKHIRSLTAPVMAADITMLQKVSDEATAVVKQLQGHLPERRAPPRVQSRLDNPFNRELCGRSPHGQGCGEDRSVPVEQCVRLGVPDVSRPLRRLRPVQLLDQLSGLRLILGWLLRLRLLLVLLSPIGIPGN